MEVCLCVTESLFCTADAITTANQCNFKKGKKRENKVAASSQNWGKGSKREERG